MYFNQIVLISIIIYNIYIIFTSIGCVKGKPIKDLPVLVTLLNATSIMIGLAGLYINKSVFTIIYTILNIVLLIMSVFGFDSC